MGYQLCVVFANVPLPFCVCVYRVIRTPPPHRSPWPSRTPQPSSPPLRTGCPLSTLRLTLTLPPSTQERALYLSTL